METTDILNRLNNLHEENEQLKQKIKELEAICKGFEKVTGAKLKSVRRIIDD